MSELFYAKALNCPMSSGNLTFSDPLWCENVTETKDSISSLPPWKRELILKKRQNNSAYCKIVVDDDLSINESEVGKSPPVVDDVESRGRTRLRTPGKGLVASLQAVYEPRSENDHSTRLQSPARGMLARPWSQGAVHHGSEPTSNPPILPKPRLETNEGFSASQSRSVNGAISARLPKTSPVSAVLAQNSSANSSHANAVVPVNSTVQRPLRRSLDTATSVLAGKMVEDTRTRNSASKMDVVDNKARMSSKSVKSMSGYRESEDEELQYGPGIVNKLKSRYLSRTLRERPAGEQRRPSLRRATSLENWLDKDVDQERSDTSGGGSAIIRQQDNDRSQRPASLNLSSPISKPQTGTQKTLDLKKTRSVDSFSHLVRRSVSVAELNVTSPPAQIPGRPSPTARTPTATKAPALGFKEKSEIIIVDKKDATESGAREKKESPTTTPTSTSSQSYVKTRRVLPTNTRYNVEDAELPAPDTVRQVKRLFETGPGRRMSGRRSQSAGPGLNRVPLSVSNQTEKTTNVERMNQVNLVNAKMAVEEAKKTSDATSGSVPRINDLAKPAISSKPFPLGPKPVIISPKPVVPIVRPAQGTGSSVDRSSQHSQVSPVQSSQQPRQHVHQPTTQTTVPTKPAAPLVPSRTAVAAIAPPTFVEDSNNSYDSESETDNVGLGIKTISKSALDNIRKEGTSVAFNFGDKKSPSPSSHQKQIGVIRPQPKSSPTSEDKPIMIIEDLSPKTGSSPSVLGEATSSVATTAISNSKSPAPTMAAFNDAKFVESKEDAKPVTPVITSNAVANLVGKPKAAPSVPTSTIQTSPQAQVLVRATSTPTPNTEKHVPTVPKEIPASSTVKSTPTAVVTKSAPFSSSGKSSNAVTIVTAKVFSSPVPTAVTPVSNAPATSTSTAPGSGSYRDSRKWQQQDTTTQIFNFIDEKKDTSHIRNQGGSYGKQLYEKNDSGIILLPGITGNEESSDYIIDDFDMVLKRPPSPCNVDFVGGNVVIEGKSSLRRRPKPKKLNISFNDGMTTLFEYPSESSLLEDNEPVSASSETLILESGKGLSTNTPLGSGGLASYTPSKVHIETSFELGVTNSRVVSPHAPPAGDVSMLTAHVVEEYQLKPAEESTTWSAESSADLLF